MNFEIAARRRDHSGRISSPGGASTEGNSSEAHIPTKHPQASEDPRLSVTDVNQGRTCRPQGPSAQGSPQSDRLSSVGRGPIDRVASTSTFEALRRPAGRAKNGFILVFFVPLPSVDGRPQVAYAVSKRCGGAVMRNKIRRRLRAAVEANAPHLSPGAYLIRTDPGVAQLPFNDLARSVTVAMARAAKEG